MAKNYSRGDTLPYPHYYRTPVKTQTHTIKIYSSLHWSETIRMGSYGYAHCHFIGFTSPAIISGRCAVCAFHDSWIFWGLWVCIRGLRLCSMLDIIVQSKENRAFRFDFFVGYCVGEEMFHCFLLTLLSLFFLGVIFTNTVTYKVKENSSFEHFG